MKNVSHAMRLIRSGRYFPVQRKHLRDKNVCQARKNVNVKRKLQKNFHVNDQKRPKNVISPLIY